MSEEIRKQIQNCIVMLDGIKNMYSARESEMSPRTFRRVIASE